MYVFDAKARDNAAYTVNDCQMMSYSHVEKDLNRNEHLNLNLEQNTSLTAPCFSQNNFCFIQNKLRA